MSLYFNGQKVKLYLDGIKYNFNNIEIHEIIRDALISSNGYYLLDDSYISLLPKLADDLIVTLDEFILIDKKEQYIAPTLKLKELFLTQEGEILLTSNNKKIALAE